ncbi:MAG: GH32 C-terminal domain-containing protein [Verrucomicrobiae bacterium]|nr:GH32 C-terminal domain-containing protein [Verrucomicrobiae bacterium]
MRNFILACGGWFLALAGVFGAPAPDILIADFEGTNYGAWTVMGTAFGPGPAEGTLPNQMAVRGYQGRRLVNSFYGGDASTGTLTSPPFRIERSYVKFLIGGGGFAGETCMNLLVDGKVVRTATGPNTRPGGSEELDWQSWEVREFLGRTGRLEIVDRATGGWGHINVDHIVLSETPAPQWRENVQRTIIAEKRYLHLPVKNGAPKRWVSLLVEGRVERDFDLELADAAPDWWAYVELRPFAGKSVVVQVDRLREDSQALALMEQGDELKGTHPLYREPLRPQFHFSARRGWLNDPNGLVYYGGEYHLFFQHNPYGWNWGNMHWGHAISRDLVHWEEMGEALYPDALGTMYSGSAVVDYRNDAGLNAPQAPALLLFYTAAGGENRLSRGRPYTQCLAYSTDRGRTWIKYERNPILPNLTPGNRDPKVIWHEASRQWIMTLYVETNKVHSIFFFGSKNLREWTYLSRTDGFFECPDFFPLTVPGEPGRSLWLLTGASSEYMLGQFDGTRFTAVTPKLPGHQGRDFYAAQTYSDIPASDGRRIQIGWLRAPSPGMPFNQCMSLPLELSLAVTPEGPRLAMLPVRELVRLRGQPVTAGPAELAAGATNPLSAARGELWEVRAEFEPAPGAIFELKVRGAEILYDAQRQELRVNGHRARAPLREGQQRLAIYLDRTTVEVFASDGLTYVPMPYIARAEEQGVEARMQRGRAKFSTLTAWPLRSIWP